jgi:hypothetical protein
VLDTEPAEQGVALLGARGLGQVDDSRALDAGLVEVFFGREGHDERLTRERLAAEAPALETPGQHGLAAGRAVLGVEVAGAGVHAGAARLDVRAARRVLVRGRSAGEGGGRGDQAAQDLHGVTPMGS